MLARVIKISCNFQTQFWSKPCPFCESLVLHKQLDGVYDVVNDDVNDGVDNGVNDGVDDCVNDGVDDGVQSSLVGATCLDQ